MPLGLDLHWNFYRIHLTFFTVHPLIWSGIFYAVNGRYKVSYIDSLFLCFSAQTVTGLSSLNLSTLTGFQQFILFWLMICGDITVVSWIMVLVRRSFFQRKCEYIVKQRRKHNGTGRIGHAFQRLRSMTIGGPFNSASYPPGTAEMHEKPKPRRQNAYPELNVDVQAPTRRPTALSLSQPLHPDFGLSQSHGQIDSPKELTDIKDTTDKSLGSSAVVVPVSAIGPAQAHHILAEDTPYTQSPPAIEIGSPLQRTYSPSSMLSHEIKNVKSATGPFSATAPNTAATADDTMTSATNDAASRTGTHPTLPNSPLSARFHHPPPAAQRTVDFALSTGRSGLGMPYTLTNRTNHTTRTNTSFYSARTGNSVASNMSNQSNHSNRAIGRPLAPKSNTADVGFGGFPTPLTLGARLAQKVAPNTYARVERRLTMVPETVLLAPASEHTNNFNREQERRESMGGVQVKRITSRTSRDEENHHDMHNTNGMDGHTDHTTNAQEHHLEPINEKDKKHKERSKFPFRSRATTRTESSDWTDTVGDVVGDVMDDIEDGFVKAVEYLKKGTLWVGRNSFFHLDDLTDDELEEVGGVEYGAIRVLSWLIPLYFIGTQLCCFFVFVAYLSTQHQYDAVFEAQPRRVPTAWFSAFQAVSAYTGGGLSLVDQGMVPFVNAKTLVVFLGALIGAGNMLMPVFLRLIIWGVYHLLPKNNADRPYWRFLLDHPRRCFLYLFPSHQTWFLVAVFFFLTAVEWSGFIVLDIGLAVTEALPTGQRVLAGLFQSLGVRASGFSIVSIGALAPACRFLYIIMMYISAYPIAMAVRGTNVYEERSLGVFSNREEQAQAAEPQEGEVFSKYLGWHVRQQLAFDIWWLAIALLLMDIIERGNLMDESKFGWFNQFTMLFEVVSAYAGVGLSLGIPTENFSFSGALSTGSKIILILVMLRGRHRDLPMSVDRAILLPEEFAQAQADAKGRHIMKEETANRIEHEAALLRESEEALRSPT